MTIGVATALGCYHPRFSRWPPGVREPVDPKFVRAWADERLRAEKGLLDHLTHLPDLQCAWLLLWFLLFLLY